MQGERSAWKRVLFKESGKSRKIGYGKSSHEKNKNPKDSKNFAEFKKKTGQKSANWAFETFYGAWKILPGVKENEFKEMKDIYQSHIFA